MTKKQLRDILKEMEQEYILKFSTYRIQQLKDLMDTLSFRHPQYDALVGFIQYIELQVQANEDLKSHMSTLTPSDDVFNDLYGSVESEYSQYLKQSYLDGAEEFLDTISWRHPQYDALEEAIKFAVEQDEEYAGMLLRLDELIGWYE